MMEKLFLDTNIVLDLIGNREPFVKEAAFLFQLGRNKECQLFVSDLTFVNIAYITRKTYPKEKLYSVLSKLRSFLTIVGGGVVAVDHAELELLPTEAVFPQAIKANTAVQANTETTIFFIFSPSTPFNVPHIYKNHVFLLSYCWNIRS